MSSPSLEHNNHGDHIHPSPVTIPSHTDSFSFSQLMSTTSSSSNPNTPLPASVVDHSAHNLLGSQSSLHSGMKMYFHTDYDEPSVLFYFWSISSIPGMVGSCIGVFILAMLYEGLKVLRQYLFERADRRLVFNFEVQSSQTSNSPLTTTESTPSAEAILAEPHQNGNGLGIFPHPTEFRQAFSGYHLLQTLLQVVQVALSYSLMLIAMTFNVWLFLSVILGSGAGHLLFAWRKRVVGDSLAVDTTCH